MWLARTFWNGSKWGYLFLFFFRNGGVIRNHPRLFYFLSGPYTCKQFAQTECLSKLLDSVGCCLRACASCLREIKTVWYFLRKQPMLAPPQTNLSITRSWQSWHCVVVPAVVICNRIDLAMSSKGTAEE